MTNQYKPAAKPSRAAVKRAIAKRERWDRLVLIPYFAFALLPQVFGLSDREALAVGWFVGAPLLWLYFHLRAEHCYRWGARPWEDAQ